MIMPCLQLRDVTSSNSLGVRVKFELHLISLCQSLTLDGLVAITNVDRIFKLQLLALLFHLFLALLAVRLQSLLDTSRKGSEVGWGYPAKSLGSDPHRDNALVTLLGHIGTFFDESTGDSVAARESYVVAGEFSFLSLEDSELDFHARAQAGNRPIITFIGKYNWIEKNVLKSKCAPF